MGTLGTIGLLLILCAALFVIVALLDRGAKASREEEIMEDALIKRKRELDRIRHAFTYHAPNKEQANKYEILRGNAKRMAYLIYDMTPESRERALAMTKLEEAIMWANAAIARNSTHG